MRPVIGQNPALAASRGSGDPVGEGAGRAVLGWAAVFVAAMLLYGLTASRSIGWQDSGQFVLRVVRGEATDPFGLCCAHPLHFWLGTLVVRLFPSNPPAAMALVSAVFGALAVANVFGMVRELTGRAAVAVLAGAGLAVAHTFWRFSTFVEVYSISAAMLTAEAWALVLWDRTRRRRFLVAMFLANGLGLANHDLALLTLPVIGIVLLLAIRAGEASWKTFASSSLAWVAGAGVYLFMIGQDAYVKGDFPAAIGSALVGKFGPQVLSRGPLLTYTAISLAFTLLSFPNVMLPAAFWGLLRARKLGIGQLSFWSLAAMLAMHLGFVLRYAVIDQYTFLMPAYALLAVFSGIGLAAVLAEDWGAPARRWIMGLSVISVAMTPAVYPVAFKLARRFQLLGGYARNKPYRDDYRYLFVPWGRGEDSAARMSREAVDLAGPGGLIIVEDPMGAWAVEYQLAIRPERQVRLASVADPAEVKDYAAQGRAIVLVPRVAGRALPPIGDALGEWEPQGELYRLQVTATSRPVKRTTSAERKGL